MAMAKRILLIGLLGAVAGVAATGDSEQTSAVSLRQVPAQTVLYTVYRGPYQTIGKAIGELYATAGKSGIRPMGPPSLVYLNNPYFVAPEHCLTEIRIPVGAKAAERSETLGAMTAIKTLRQMEVAVLAKPTGSRDYAGAYQQLHAWIQDNGYRTSDNVCEAFSGGAMAGFDNMKSELMIPITKLHPEK